MKPAKVILFVASTLLLTAGGMGCLVAGVHGPRAASYAGAFLLLPSVILMKLGVPIAMPVFYRTTVLSAAVFCLLQLGYYYGLLRLLSYVLHRVRPPRRG